MDFFVEDLLGSAQLRTLAPQSQNTFEDSDLITAGTEEMLLKAVSDIERVREDFFLRTKLVPLVSGVSYYPIPTRAIGGAFSSLHFVDANGEVAGESLARIDSSRRDELVSGAAPRKFFIEGDEVVIAEPAVTSGSLLFTYPAKPNRLIATASCAKITAVTLLAPNVIFTVDTDLTGSLVVGEMVDILSSNSPFLLWTEDSAITAVSSTQIQVALSTVVNGADVVEPQVGDYICPARTANIPMIPEEYHPVLAQMLAVRILAALGHAEKWQMAKAELKEVRAEAAVMLKNRVQSSPKRVSASRNGLIRAFGR